MGAQAQIAFPAPAAFEERLLTREEVEEMTTLSCSEIYRRLKVGVFPAPRKLGPRAVAWKLSAIQQWIASLPEAGYEAADVEKSTELPRSVGKGGGGAVSALKKEVTRKTVRAA